MWTPQWVSMRLIQALRTRLRTPSTRAWPWSPRRQWQPRSLPVVSRGHMQCPACTPQALPQCWPVSWPGTGHSWGPGMERRSGVGTRAALSKALRLGRRPEEGSWAGVSGRALALHGPVSVSGRAATTEVSHGNAEACGAVAGRAAPPPSRRLRQRYL